MLEVQPGPHSAAWQGQSRLPDLGLGAPESDAFLKSELQGLEKGNMLHMPNITQPSGGIWGSTLLFLQRNKNI